MSNSVFLISETTWQIYELDKYIALKIKYDSLYLMYTKMNVLYHQISPSMIATKVQVF